MGWALLARSAWMYLLYLRLPFFDGIDTWSKDPSSAKRTTITSREVCCSWGSLFSRVGTFESDRRSPTSRLFCEKWGGAPSTKIVLFVCGARAGQVIAVASPVHHRFKSWSVRRI